MTIKLMRIKSIRCIIASITLTLLSLFFSAPTQAADGDWMKDPSGWWFLNLDGTYPSESWFCKDNAWYYFDQNGYMQTGWLRSEGNFYRFRETGDMIVGWFYDEDTDNWYYMEDDGRMSVGWISIEDDWYWAGPKGKLVTNGWKTIDGQTYYFYKDGKMAKNSYVGINFIDSEGKKETQNDMIIEGGKKPSQAELRRITDNLATIPGKLFKAFIDSGWQFIYYSNKSYLGAVNTVSDGIYFERHKVDSNYKKIKFCQGADLAAAFGEYFNTAYGKPAEDSDFGITLAMEWDNVSHCFSQPAYFKNRTDQSFGALFALYFDPYNKDMLMEDARFFYDYIDDSVSEVLQGVK